jgi:hypothetical protein
MGSYNAFAEKKINDLIEEACNEGNLPRANEILKSATYILEKKFISHPNDSDEDDFNRIKSKLRIYQEILGAYDEIFSQLPDDEEHRISTFKQRLSDI